jgi:transcriptional regulator with XRE-family HTH domain
VHSCASFVKHYIFVRFIGTIADRCIGVAMPSPLGEKIRSRRGKLDMSLDQLAKLTDSSKGYLWELENRDKPNPSTDKLTRIAQALGVTPEFLLEAGDAAPDEKVEDLAFFRKYQSLDPKDKSKFRRMLESWDDET